MIIRPLQIATLASLVALTQVLAACSDSSAAAPADGGSEPDSAAPTTSGDPAVFGDAIDTSAEADDAEMLSNLLITGRSSDDSESYWSCTSFSADGSDDSFYIRFWSDTNGYIRESTMNWQASDATSAELRLADSVLTLGDVLFSDVDVAFDRFTARTGDETQVDCLWGGPSRYEELTPQADAGTGLRTFLSGEVNARDWSCTLNQPDGSVTASLLSYGIDSTGTGDNGPFSWYFDDDLLFMAGLDDDTVDVFYEFDVVNDDAASAPLAFEAGNDDASVSCSSNG